LYTIDELVPTDYIRANLSNKQLREYDPVSYKTYRNLNKLSKIFGSRILRIFFDLVIDKVMQSNRVILPTNRVGINRHEIYIEEVSKSHEKYLNSHTNGAVYNAVITGFNNPVYVKLNAKRKQELKKRLEEGQLFY